MANTNETRELFNGLLADIKKFAFGETKPNEKQAFAMNGTLEDGTPVMIDADMPNVGVKVIVQNADGVEAPIADGEYTVKVGEQSIKIKTVGGVITEAETPEAPVGEPQPNNEEMANEKLTALEQRISALEESMKSAPQAEKVEAATNEVREITVKMQSQIDLMNKENGELKIALQKSLEGIEKELNTPATPPTHTPAESTLTREQRMAEFRKSQGLI